MNNTAKHLWSEKKDEWYHGGVHKCHGSMGKGEEWERDHKRLQEEVTLDLDLVSAFEIRTCSFKL